MINRQLIQPKFVKVYKVCTFVVNSGQLSLNVVVHPLKFIHGKDGKKTAIN